MPRRIFMGLVAVLVAVLALSVAMETMAGECANDSYPIWVKGKTGPLANTGYVLNFTGVAEFTALDGKKYYKWSYLIGPGNQTVSNFQILVPAPNSCEAPNTYYCITGNGQPGDCGTNNLTPPPDPDAGTTASFNPYFGFALWQYQTIRVTRDNSSGSYILFTDKISLPKPTSVYIQSGGVDWFAETLGPSAPQNGLVPVSTNQHITIDGNSYNLIREPFTGCISGVELCANGFNQPCTPLAFEPAVVGNESILNCASTTGTSGCQECTFNATGSPHSTNIVSGGYASVYKYCYSTEYWLYGTNAYANSKSTTRTDLSDCWLKTLGTPPGRSLVP